MSSNDNQERFDEAVHEIYSVYPSLSPDKTYLNRQWPELARHLPQVLGLEKEIQENETLTPNKKFAVILCNATWYLFEQNEHEKVAELLPTLYTVTMATATGNEFFVAQIYRLFLVMKLDAREYALARAYATKMLEALKSLKAVDPFALADGYNAVGLCMLGVGNYPGAEYYLRRSPTLREEFPDRNAGMRGITLANLALCHNLRGQYVEALKRGKQGLKLVEEHLGKGSFKAAEVYFQVGNAYIGHSRLDDALEMHTTALNIRESNFGDGYKVAASLHKIGWIHSQQGKNDDATRYLHRALDIYKSVSKTEEFGRTSYLLATVLAALRREEEAKEAKAVAAQIRKDILGLEPEDQDNQASYDLLIFFEQR